MEALGAVPAILMLSEDTYTLFVALAGSNEVSYSQFVQLAAMIGAAAMCSYDLKVWPSSFEALTDTNYMADIFGQWLRSQ